MKFLEYLDFFFTKPKETNKRNISEFVIVFSEVRDPILIREKLLTKSSNLISPSLVKVVIGECQQKKYAIAYIRYPESISGNSRFFMIDECKESEEDDISEAGHHREYWPYVTAPKKKIKPERLFNDLLGLLDNMEVIEDPEPPPNSLSQLVKTLRGPGGRKYSVTDEDYIKMGWDGDHRITAMNDIKKLVGLEPVKIKYSKHFLHKGSHNYATLDKLNHKLISSEDLEKIRLVYAFRYMMGMYPNNDSCIAIINGNPVSYIDTFPMGTKTKDYGFIERKVLDKWFSGVDIRDYIRKLPIFRDCESSQIINIKYQLIHEISELLTSEKYNDWIGSITSKIVRLSSY